MTRAAESKTIVLVRHAEAAAAPPGGQDAERVLTEQGQERAEDFGRWLRAHGMGCDEVITSPAARARQTVEAIACGGRAEAEVQVERRLYEGEVDDVLQVLRESTPDAELVLVVGHAPTVPAAVSLLADGEGADAAHEALSLGFPPGAAAVLRYQGQWSDLSFGAASLEDFRTP